MADVPRPPADVLEDAIELAADVRGELVGTGLTFAMIYLDAAIRSMRHSRAALIRAALDEPPAARKGAWRRLVFSDGMPTSVLLSADPADDVWIRGAMEDGAIVRRDGAECDWRLPRAVDLGADLLASVEARTLAAAPAGAALLMDALARTAWFRPASATRWTSGVAAARSIVAALAGGADIPALAPGLAGARVDREVLGVIERLGWRRDPAARWRARGVGDVQAAGTDCRV